MVEAIQLESAGTWPPVATDLGAYRLGEVLGSGGMGQVFRAEHRTLERKVAIKLLHPHLSSDPELVRRFFTEAKIVNRINHEHIVEIHDFVVEPDGRSYFVMELLQGQSLAAVPAPQLSIARTLAIAAQICSALKAAHDQGVVHRDLKPENVMLVERDGRPDFVKILDFGIAKVPQLGSTGTQTVAGLILGTPEYMSPEQAGGRPVDLRSDIYAFGVLLTWMLSGTVPFKASAFDKLILLRLTTKPPPLPARTLAGEWVPPALARIVARCLERDPGDRFQSMAEVAKALAQVSPLPAGSRPRPRRLWLLAPLAFALGGAALWWGLREPVPTVQALVAAPSVPPETLPPVPRPPVARPAAPPGAARTAPKHAAHPAPREAAPSPVDAKRAIVNPYNE